MSLTSEFFLRRYCKTFSFVIASRICHETRARPNVFEQILNKKSNGQKLRRRARLRLRNTTKESQIIIFHFRVTYIELLRQQILIPIRFPLRYRFSSMFLSFFYQHDNVDATVFTTSPAITVRVFDAQLTSHFAGRLRAGLHKLRIARSRGIDQWPNRSIDQCMIDA